MRRNQYIHMKLQRLPSLASVMALVACGIFLPLPAAFAQDTGEAEVLTRGPLHEAFAGAVDFNPEAGILISAQPPEAIEELPPEFQPEGENVTWISGYWAWDEEREDYLWVSGIWRNVPPDREWIPGYWNESGDRYQWVSGYWADAETSEVTYLPPPPQTEENGPNVDPPSADDSWIPGVWVWGEDRYLWRPGYWEPMRANWTYVPDHYRWTPRGHIHVGGYWDHEVARRGVVFAPVYFHRGSYSRPGFHYSPTTVISISLLTNHLFVRPAYSHYYYGDYYEPRYRDSGFFASFSYHSGHRGYDPIYAHQRWSHRRDKGWERGRRDDFDYYRDHRDACPPRTWAGSRELPDGRRGSKDRHGDYVVASPIGHYAKSPDKGERFKPVDSSSRDRIMAQRKDLSQFKKERKLREAETSVARRGNEGEGPSKVSTGRFLPLANPGSEVGGVLEGGRSPETSTCFGNEHHETAQREGGGGDPRKAFGSQGRAQARVPQPAQGRAQARVPQPAQGRAQARAPQPAQGRAQARAPQPAQGRAQARAPEPAQGRAQARAPQPAQGRAQARVPQPAQGRAQARAP